MEENVQIGTEVTMSQIYLMNCSMSPSMAKEATQSLQAKDFAILEL